MKRIGFLIVSSIVLAFSATAFGARSANTFGSVIGAGLWNFLKLTICIGMNTPSNHMNLG